MAIAGCSQLIAGILLLPTLFLFPPSQPVTMMVVLNVLGLALLCSAVAYLLYYRLIADIGSTKALTVTFLMPVFGMIWGTVFLKETITMQMIAGCTLIIVGVCFVLKLLKPKVVKIVEDYSI